jgi:chorismate synthase
MFVQSVLNSAVEMVSYVVQVGPLQLSDQDVDLASEMSREQVDDFVARFPSPSQRVALEKLLIEAKAQGESYGARVELVLKGLPQGLGEPVFHKLKADLASAFMGVGACVGVEFGHGFSGVAIPGTLYHSIDTSTANSPYGGIRGGISTGETLRVRMAIKPTSSILDVAKKGRHDPCIAPRALPVFESMAWLVIADHLLAQRLSRLSPNI